MKDGLFEMRMKSKEGVGRVFYCTLVNKRIYWIDQYDFHLDQLLERGSPISST
jgi:hypothetical protein